MRTIKSAFEELKNMGIPYYCYAEGYSDEATCIERDGDEWIVYYGERGDRSFIKRFLTESEACDYLIATVKRNETGQA